MKRYIMIILCCVLVASQAWGATYYKRYNGSAANKEAAGGPCSVAANCMSSLVYASETFADGDVIVHCYSPQGIPGKIWSHGFADVSQILYVAPSFLLLESDGYLLLESGDKLVLE